VLTCSEWTCHHKYLVEPYFSVNLNSWLFFKVRKISNKSTILMEQFHKFFTWRLCLSTCFRRLHAHHQELATALTASGFTLERGGSSVVGRGLAGQTTTNSAAITNAPTVKPETVNAVVSSWWWAWRRLKHVERHINVK